MNSMLTQSIYPLLESFALCLDTLSFEIQKQSSKPTPVPNMCAQQMKSLQSDLAQLPQTCKVTDAQSSLLMTHLHYRIQSAHANMESFFSGNLSQHDFNERLQQDQQWLANACQSFIK